MVMQGLKAAFTPVLLFLLSTRNNVVSRPNIIIMQPDDMDFFNEWLPPPNNPSGPNKRDFSFPETNGLPNIETLRLGGLQMMEAYTASPACATSRYSTITGKYPSRSASARDPRSLDGGKPTISVTVPMTKLMDVGNEKDCTEENIAVVLKESGYRTGMVGKWHLSKIDKDSYNYFNAVDTVKNCGFDFVDALYVENMSADPEEFDSYSDGTFSHNMEFVTYEAIKFINDDDGDKPFFLYINPTVPHGSQVVKTALTDFSCQDTPRKNVESDFVIKGMTKEFDGSCEAYRADVMKRADTDADLGSIWLDDSVGALLQALKDKNILDNTFFLFQQDHGVETKMALYENGNRIAQFIHYPAVFSAGSKFDTPVSTIDIAATILDFAEVKELPYPMDGKSWGNDVHKSTSKNMIGRNRCLFFEIEFDRAVRCGCYKLLNIANNRSKTFRRGVRNGYGTDLTNLFDLCGGTNSYITASTDNQEREGKNLASWSNKSSEMKDMKEMMDCHLQRTYHTTVPGNYTSCEVNLQTDTPTVDLPTASPTAAPYKTPDDSTSSTITPLTNMIMRITTIILFYIVG